MLVGKGETCRQRHRMTAAWENNGWRRRGHLGAGREDVQVKRTGFEDGKDNEKRWREVLKYQDWKINTVWRWKRYEEMIKWGNVNIPTPALWSPAAVGGAAFAEVGTLAVTGDKLLLLVLDTLNKLEIHLRQKDVSPHIAVTTMMIF